MSAWHLLGLLPQNYPQPSTGFCRLLVAPVVTESCGVRALEITSYQILVHFFVSDSLLVSASLFVRLCSEAARPEWRIGSHSSCFPRAGILCRTGIAEQRTSFPQRGLLGQHKGSLVFFSLIRSSCQILSSRVGGGRERGKEINEVWNPLGRAKSLPGRVRAVLSLQNSAS